MSPAPPIHQRYYDDFSLRYDRARGRAYHCLVDRLEIESVAPYLAGAEALDLACGTGLTLMALHEQTRRAVGADLSGGMLAAARRRGLRVVQASAERLPFESRRFDLVTCFKAFPHLPRRRACLVEIRRVLRPGGRAAVELYNPVSLRGLLRRLGPRRAVSGRYHEGHIPTRYDTLGALAARLPPGLQIEAAHGIRVVTPAGGLLGWPAVGPALARLERRLSAHGASRHVAGFVVVVLRRDDA
jgi:SAM-dependent methyltransferase